MNSIQNRNERLAQLSQMVIDGHIVHKLDQIATIHINNRYYFTVFRRYNSPYNIVIEDYNGDIYLHKDQMVRSSLKTIMCMSDHEISNMYTWNATSYKYNGPPPSTDKDIADMRWSEIQGLYHEVSVNFGGIFYGIPATLELPQVDVEPPSTPISQIHSTPENPPGAPERPIKSEEIDAAHILLSLSIPKIENPFVLRECDGPTLSMRFSDINTRNNHVGCYCQMDESDEGEDEFNPTNYTELRSGRLVPK
jgi:hypothetical protein